MPLHVALFQPDIPGNCGTILRLAACIDFHVHIIEPAGFDLSNRSLKRAAMDYFSKAVLTRHLSWDHFKLWQDTRNKRIVLFTTQSQRAYTDICYQSDDILLFGSETSGVPDYVHSYAQDRVTIAMKNKARSINLAMSVAIAAGEATRQLSTDTY